jgi:hypothetical protein
MAISIEVKVRLVPDLRRTPSNRCSASIAAAGKVLRLISLFARDPCSITCLHSSFGTGTETGNTLLIGSFHYLSSISSRDKGEPPVAPATGEPTTPSHLAPYHVPQYIPVPMPYPYALPTRAHGSTVDLIYDLSFQIRYKISRAIQGSHDLFHKQALVFAVRQLPEVPVSFAGMAIDETALVGDIYGSSSFMAATTPQLTTTTAIYLNVI